MLDLRNKMARFIRNREHWEKLLGKTPISTPPVSPLQEVHGFGANPGNLRMFNYLPATLAPGPALVVVLHGCTQTAAAYNYGAGWSTLADRHGFALLLPEQQQSNNPNRCFNWFQPADVERGLGEVHSIRQMIDKLVTDRGIDRRRVFVTGLSAGGAMTCAMLACYPEVFAAGAIIAGLPYGGAANAQQAFERMFQSPPRPAREWGDVVRKASSHRGPWPRVSLWHGDADKTVIPANARELLKQWTDIHGLPSTATTRSTVDGYPRDVWIDATGGEIIESFTITTMGHGTPLSTKGKGAVGAAGPFLIDVGISSTDHIAKFFGLTGMVSRDASDTKDDGITTAVELLPESGAGVTRERVSPVLEGEVLEKDSGPQYRGLPPSPAIDVGEVIKKALKKAGLM